MSKTNRLGRAGVTPAVRKLLAEIKACERSGESLRAYAERRGFSVRTLYEAKRQARRLGLLPPHGGQGGGISARGRSRQRPSPSADPTASFVEVIARPRGPEAGAGFGAAWRLRLSGGDVLESTEPLGMEGVARLVDILRRSHP